MIEIFLIVVPANPKNESNWRRCRKLDPLFSITDRKTKSDANSNLNR